MHRSTHPAIVSLLGMAVTLLGPGCAREPSGPRVEQTARRVAVESPAVESDPRQGRSVAAEADEKEHFERMLNHKLERLDEEIREVVMRIANLGEAARAEWAQKLAELDAKRRAAEARLDAIRRSAEGAWEHLREGADRAWEELEQAVEQARREF